MPNLSTGINIALQAVLAHSQSIEIIEHNVANAATKGYRRQSAVLAATVTNPMMFDYYSTAAGQMGTGVIAERIQRFSDGFFDGRYRSVAAGTKSWEFQGEILTQMESILSDMSGDGLAIKMDEFWLAWQNLASDPTNAAMRGEVISDAVTLCEKFNRNAQQLIALRQDQNLKVRNCVDEINTLSQSIADLNDEISKVVALGHQPNDLMDQRDMALDRLAELTGAVSFSQPNGEVVVSIGGHVLVTGHEALMLKTETGTDAKTLGMENIVWVDDSKPFVSNGGELEGILKVRDTYIPDHLNQLNIVAENIVNLVNTQHKLGYCPDGSQGGDFFVAGRNALDIEVTPGLQAEDIAASSNALEVGNNENASLIFNLRNMKILGGGTQTLGEYYNGKVSELALITKQACNSSAQHAVVLEALENQRQSLSGVSLDEEAANLAKAQKAYQAAARVMTAYDELLDVVINQMGLVGR